MLQVQAQIGSCMSVSVIMCNVRIPVACTGARVWVESSNTCSISSEHCRGGSNLEALTETLGYVIASIADLPC